LNIWKRRYGIIEQRVTKSFYPRTCLWLEGPQSCRLLQIEWRYQELVAYDT